jgi:hypothetical protein
MSLIASSCALSESELLSEFEVELDSELRSTLRFFKCLLNLGPVEVGGYCVVDWMRSLAGLIG